MRDSQKRADESKRKEQLMATIMEKDVLLELVSTGLGSIHRAILRGDTTEESSQDDTDFLTELRNKLYKTSESEWDFRASVDEIKSRYAKYERAS